MTKKDKHINIIVTLLCITVLLFNKAAFAEVIKRIPYPIVPDGIETESEYPLETETESETEEYVPQPNSYTDEELYLLSHIIQCEAGYCERAMMEGVGSVVLNRVADPRFPNTIYEVINQPGQYRPVTDGIFTSAVPTELAIEVSIDLLEWGSKFPPEVVWQANFPQGTGTYLTLSTSYSTMYFCY